MPLVWGSKGAGRWWREGAVKSPCGKKKVGCTLRREASTSLQPPREQRAAGTGSSVGLGEGVGMGEAPTQQRPNPAPQLARPDSHCCSHLSAQLGPLFPATSRLLGHCRAGLLES